MAGPAILEVSPGKIGSRRYGSASVVVVTSIVRSTISLPAGFQIVELRTSYLPGPRPMTYTYQDSRIRYKKCIMLESPFTQTDETELAIRRIQWFTIIWMAVEVAVAFMAAIRAHSVALAAFGGTVRSSSCRLQWYSYASAHLAGSRNNLRAKSPPGFWSCLPRILQLTRSTR